MPIVGSLFTAYAKPPKNKGGDKVISAFPNWNGFVIGESEYLPDGVWPGEYYRFIVSSVHRRKHTNFFYAIPFRSLDYDEDTHFNILDARGFHEIERLWSVFYDEVGRLDIEERLNSEK